MPEPSLSEPNLPDRQAPSEVQTKDQAQALLAELQELALRLRQVSGAINNGILAPAVRAVLNSLDREGCQTVPQLGRSRGTSRQNVQIIVNRLSDRGYVQAITNPAHKRSELVIITERGKEQLRKSPDPQQRVASHLAREISVVDLERGITLLKKVKLILNKIGSSQTVTEKKPEPRPSQSGGIEQSADNELPVNLL